MVHLINDNTEVINIINQEVTNVSGAIEQEMSQELAQPDLFIPIPNIVTYEGSQKLATKWYSHDKEFLKYNPKYYLFRYRGKGGFNISKNKSRRKGYYHPTHRNGITSSGHKGWWGGSDRNNDGSLIPPRNTEWAVPTAEGLELELDIPFQDWTYVANSGSLPAIRYNLRIRGASSNSAFSAYFKLAIGIETKVPTTGCPIIFGEMSESFSIKPRSSGTGAGIYNCYGWYIGT